MARSRAAGEARARDVERTPPEMHRTRLPEELPAELLEHAAGLNEYLPAPLRRIRIVRRMRFVVSERRRVRQLGRNRADLHIDVERREHRHVSPIEITDRLWLERNSAALAVGCPDGE